MRKRSSGLDVVVGLLLVCVFAVCMFFTLASGAGIYKDISRVMDEQFGARTAMGYVTAKLHQSDKAGAVELSELQGVPALRISEELDGEAYVTYIYCWEGSITELFCPESESLGPEAGLAVVPAQSLDFAAEGSLLRIDCVTGSGAESAWVYLRSGMGGEA